MDKDFFAQKASDYEKNRSRVENVENIANGILQAIEFDESMHIADFGSGTGLLLEKIAPKVNKITAIDVSPSMNAKLLEKAPSIQCQLEILPIDLTATELTNTKLNQSFDGIISSMTLHHIADVPAIMKILFALVRRSGFIAIADLDTEDGSFHSEDTGVHHHGFDHPELLNATRAAGFQNCHIQPVSVVKKPQGDYPVFLLTATKP